MTKYYTWSPTGHLLSITTGGATYYPVRNGHGDITKILDAQGNIVATYKYDAFGNLVESAGQTDLSPYRYAGYRYDEVSGLYDLQARYYHPESGQFLSLDPASELPDYTYAANNPVTYIDPSGNFILDAIAIAIDLNNFIKEPTWANFGWLASNAISLFIPGNISLTAKAVKSVQSLSHTADATRTIGKTDEIASGAKKVKSSTPKSKSPSAKSNKTTKDTPKLTKPAAGDNIGVNLSSQGKGKTYEQARNEALSWLEERGFQSEKQTFGKFGYTKNEPIGRQTIDGKVGFRIEYDSRSGAHINVWAGKEKGPHFEFDASEKTVRKIQKRFR